ncbi:MAG: Asp-tRNA(Asn)/Glu-tRNA(Gln) amidotransferase subunit GatA [Geminicoccaceae bacterium]|nr:Asp-tRNA(Asn)/Glu-tRNA(Gln) amidotransferase subunit GatA [Geminicoccaceae bacterium]MCB9942038.1 Asp-tRNA(Asn)/Glu-tRNA(Gln) amidotransferase subunit GatA [Geminicoccaceae bacterium]
MKELLELSMTEARSKLARREISSVELTQAHVDAVAGARDLNAFILETPDRALEMARASDVRIAANEAGLMEGLPVAIKDLFCTSGIVSTAASHILDGFVPTYESRVTANLWKAGAVCLGKTNLDEFAMGSSNMTSHHGRVKNPWTRKGDNADLVPGGSSGGSAAAVAARIALAATGTDTGGSIRQPASFTGIVGLKPTYGRCSRWGIIAFASSLDQAGPMTRTVADAALMLQAMAGFDANDMTSANLPVPDWPATLKGDVRGRRIGIPREYRVDGLPADIERLWQRGSEQLRDAGAEIVEIGLPHTKYALPTYYIIAPAEASSNLARYDGMRFGLRVEGEDLTDTYMRSRAQGFGTEVKRRILIGTYVLSAGYYDAYYVKAQKVRRRIVEDFSKAFETVDAILTPTAPSAPFRAGEMMDDPVAMYLNDVFTVPSSLAGLPAISVPAGLDGEGLPLGLQVIGRPFDEQTVLDVGAALERAASFDVRPYGLGE